MLSMEFADLGEWVEPVLYVDDGTGFSESLAIRLPSARGGRISRLVHLPPTIHALRLDPMAKPGRVRVSAFSIQPITSLAALRHALDELDGDMAVALSRCAGHHQENSRKVGISRDEYAQWIAHHDTLSEEQHREIAEDISHMKAGPTFSVVMPVYNTHLPWLKEAIDSVTGQLYPHWELLLVNDASPNADVAPFLDGIAATDRRIRVAHRKVNGGIVAASNDALSMATGDWVVTVDHDDRMPAHAFYHLATAAIGNPDAGILYTDHDHLTPAGERDNPYFKPDWNYELALGQNLVNHLSAFRREDVLRVGGFREGFDGSQDWDLLLRLVEKVPPEGIIHIPHVLYHWRIAGGNFSQTQAKRSWDAGQRAVEEHLARTGQEAEVHSGANSAGHLAIRWRLPDDPPLVSIVIPTRDRLDLLRQCVDGLLHRTDYPKIEILIVDNGSVEPETHAWYKSMAGEARLRVLDAAGEFNFSHLCNRGVGASNGDVYLLLNNDIDVIHPDWLSEMVSHALRPGIGAVGAKLYYPDGTIQHGGVILGIGGVAGHAHTFLPQGADGYQGRARLTQRLSAVTAACLAGRKDVYNKVGGFNEKDLKVAFNDVDFCLRVREAGYGIIWTPLAELFHHESASRGADTNPEKAARFAREVNYMTRKWNKQLQNDPFYSPHFSLSGHMPAFSVSLDRDLG
ncbi:MAG: glycosyltransferase family 2 protein [Nitrospirota bacterium]|nr:glycosyltransferase family 2 protein [Nitrospirota bacterium]